jgi:hypothetical protein
MPEEQLSRLSIYCDAGIRDFLISAVGMNWFFGSLKGRVGGAKAKDYTTFNALTPGASDYDFLAVDYSPAGIGQYAYVRYGNIDASPQEILQGDGNHVGTGDQVIGRLLTSITFIQSRFHVRDVRAVHAPQDVSAAIQQKNYHSTILADDRPYGIVFPPGYDDPANANERYPVLYMLHGQDMSLNEFLSSGLLFFGYMAGSAKPDTMRRDESDWAKMILVFPDSLCGHSECQLGNFNTNFVGTDGHGPRYEDALFELFALIEKTYRVAVPVEVPLSGDEP